MVKLSLPAKPAKLTDEFVVKQTEIFIKTKKSVWNKKFIKDAVFNISNGKCCYCEVKLGEEGKYMEVEHFHPKSLYPAQVLKWGNLLPALNRVNSVKGNLDTKKVKIVNPLVDDPKKHIYFKGFRLKHKSSIGNNTIVHLDLNNWKHFIKKRAKIGCDIEDILENLRSDFDNISNKDFNENSLAFKKLFLKYKNLLEQGNRKRHYAALTSTVILKEPDNTKIEALLKEKKLWDKELGDLKEELLFCALL